VSGVVYLTPTDPSAQTVFMKSPGGLDFAFKNDHPGVAIGPFNAEKWISPAPQPGDLVLFPSYLMHAVPPNAGGRRITMAFNAIPSRIESWGYTIRFSG
jgi:Putative 2OG-Fe(II) oxygenase